MCPASDDVIARERRLTIERLQEHRRALAAELRRVNKQLADLGDAGKRGPKRVKYAVAYGTLWALRRYVNQLPAGAITTSAEAEAWMLANGWRTRSRTPRSTVASAMKHMADRGGEGLEWEGTGKYRRTGPG